MLAYSTKAICGKLYESLIDAVGSMMGSPPATGFPYPAAAE
jgi:hypothetical protein